MEELFKEYRAAARAQDVERFVALYDDDVVIFDLWGRWSYQGRAAWRLAVTEWFHSLGEGGVDATFSDIVTHAGDHVAVVHAVVTYTHLSADGGPTRSMDNRLTWTLRRGDAGWLVVHEHTSAPVDFDTMRVLLKR